MDVRTAGSKVDRRAETFPLTSLPRLVREGLYPGRYLVCRDQVLHVVEVHADTFDAIVL